MIRSSKVFPTNARENRTGVTHGCRRRRRWCYWARPHWYSYQSLEHSHCADLQAIGMMLPRSPYLTGKHAHSKYYHLCATPSESFLISVCILERIESKAPTLAHGAITLVIPSLTGSRHVHLYPRPATSENGAVYRSSYMRHYNRTNRWLDPG
ncbi:hypothetical protein L210DRAFT_3471910 [Boletus edulis BED1]|uniref:Uncharacterized protein n=1 Tax=Boletus edulis BED1 TaxID=1328754 RepID=A0AAD4C6I0_BOLED|nr:hypothetical protein L210DRAFT_3471910 [Boletus edulis BED1]